MRLLVVTQVVDRNDSFLGFFHRWLEEFALHYERIHVICLQEGVHALPENVSVHSLGKEEGASRSKYIRRLFTYAWTLRDDYDAVFVHMNQEYILLAGWFWKLMGKRIYLWRNHYAGNFLTDIAVAFAAKVFCTSKHSYTARYAKTVLMPIGLDVHEVPEAVRIPGSILFLARFMPSKRPHVLIAALGRLHEQGVSFTASLYGRAPDEAYRTQVENRIRAMHLAEVHVRGEVSHEEVNTVFGVHDIYVNLSSSGTYDKTLFEAIACGCLVLTASRDFCDLVGDAFFIRNADDSVEVADVLHRALALTFEGRRAAAAKMRDAALIGQDLLSLAERIAEEVV